MTLVGGERAIAAAENLVQGAALCTLASDPAAGRGRAPRVLALAARGQHVLIDVAQTPNLSSVWAKPLPFAAANAQRMHHALLAAGHQGPSRWACAEICHKLLEYAQPPSQPAGAATSSVVAAAARQAGIVLTDPAQSIEALGLYACQLHSLIEYQAQGLKALQMAAVSRLEAACVAPIAEMEHRGLPFDRARWRALAESDSRALQQLSGWMRSKLAAPSLELTHDAALLAALAAVGVHPRSARRRDLASVPEPWGPKLVALRTLQKRLAAWGVEFLAHAGPDERVHPSFVQLGASTGRMACHAPNVQAITKEGGRQSCFRVEDADRLVIADYKACELRILAHLSEDPVFLDAFAQGQDVHAQVAAQLFGTNGSTQQRAEWRQVAKVVSFGLVYGMGPRGLGKTLNVSIARAEELQTAYFAQFPHIKAYLGDSEATGARLGYATTLAGRRLWLGAAGQPGARSELAPNQDAAARRRVARNMPIQGTSADIIKLALARLHNAWRDAPEIGVINCIHDEIVVQCPRHRAERVKDFMAQQMQQAAESLVHRVTMAVEARISCDLSGSI